MGRAEIQDFTDSFTFSYHSDLQLKLAATGTEMHRTDENTLQKVG